MKEFDLDAALNGEPVMLRNGNKAFIFKNILGTPILDFEPDYPLIGMIHNHPVTKTWSLDGRISSCNDCAPGDIVGMWEEPKISVEDLPKPFYPKEDEPYFYINGGVIEYESEFWNSNSFDISAARGGNCFRTRQDARKWLDFMKGMTE